MSDISTKSFGSSTISSAEHYYRLNRVNKSYLIFADTCSLMVDKANYVFIDAIGKQLKKTDMKLIIAKKVVDELYKHQANKSDALLSRNATKGLKIIQAMMNSGLCDIFEDKNEPFTDQLFLTLFTKFRAKYNLLMVTNDKQLAYDLLALNTQKSVQSNKSIEVCFISGIGELVQYEQKHKERQSQPQKRAAIKNHKHISPSCTLSDKLKADYTVRACSYLPKEGDVVFTKNGDRYKLNKKIDEGGEGSTYFSDNNFVCKIYRRDKLTEDRFQKLHLMTSSPLKYQGICWPLQIVYNSKKEFVGYLMELAKGELLQKCVFIPMLINKKFPNWNRANLVNLAITIVDKIKFLHDNNIIMGDINPRNIMVQSDSEVYFIDTDSYQIDGYPCPVGTVHYTAPEIQGRDFKGFLRTFEHEKFAVATLIFMILLPGKPPFSQIDGASPGENIKKQDFSFPLGEESNQKTPLGPWRFIWSHLSFLLKEAFFDTFRNNKRISASQWLSLLHKYKWNIKYGYNTNELFPKQFKTVNPVTAYCSICNKEYIESKEFVDRLNSEGKSLYCSACREKGNFKKSQTTIKTINRPIPTQSIKPQQPKPQQQPIRQVYGGYGSTMRPYQTGSAYGRSQAADPKHKQTYNTPTQSPNPVNSTLYQQKQQTSSSYNTTQNKQTKTASGSGCLIQVFIVALSAIILYIFQIIM